MGSPAYAGLEPGRRLRFKVLLLGGGSRTGLRFCSYYHGVSFIFCRNIRTIYFRKGAPDWSIMGLYLLTSNYGLTPSPALRGLRHVEFFRARQIRRRELRRHRTPGNLSMRSQGTLADQNPPGRVTDYNTEKEELFPPKTSKSLKRIHLSHLDISPDMLAIIICIPAALEELSVSVTYMWCNDCGILNENLPFLSRALRQHKRVLRLLNLN